MKPIGTCAILWEDDDIYVAFKASGVHSVMLTGGAENDEAPVLAGEIAATIPAAADASESPYDAGLVQRLDFDTAGILLGAKTRAAWHEMRERLARGEVTKRYTVVTEGRAPESAELRSYLYGRHRRSERVSVSTASTPPPRSLPAETTFRRLGYDAASDLSLVSASALAARRHQVRAHAAHLGFPLCGDTLYGSTRTLPRDLSATLSDGYAAPGHVPGFLLLASEIALRHPFRDTPLSFTHSFGETLTARFR